MYNNYIKDWKLHLQEREKKFKNYHLNFCNNLIDQVSEDVEKNKKITIVPFVKKVKKRKKFLRDNVNKKRIVEKQTKDRNIFIAFGKTSILYSFFTFYLQDRYEKFIKDNAMQENIIAYRSIIDESSGEKKCNTHFAREVFDFIEDDREYLCLVVDIESFFDNISHKILIEKLKVILKTEKFEEYFNYILKNITKYKFIEEDLYPSREEIRKNYYSFLIPKYKKKKMRKYARKNFKNKVSQNKEGKGIPQGISISGVLSNIYMLDFDRFFIEYVKNLNGIYRRYSDDIIFILPKENLEMADIDKTLSMEIKKIQLKLSASKYQSLSTGDKKYQLIYLGFIKTSNNVFMKPNSIAKYYKSKSFLSKKIYKTLAKKKKISSDGSKFKWLASPNSKGKKDFINYVKRAQNVFSSKGKITLQMRRRNIILKRIIKNRWEKTKSNSSRNIF